MPPSWLPIVLAIVAGLLVLWLLVLGLFWLVRPRGVPIGELVRLVPDTLRLIRSLITDANVPPDVRVVMVGLLAWLLSPIDLIPEFIPVLGPIDDVVVGIAAMRYARWRIGIDGLRRRWAGTEAGFATLARITGTGGTGAG
ncbi:MAG: DUF1232 domain-containing protein [Chloroflexi bacterium]|nr:DUF1232 domain-containing protein [Chloroflexota bacterium]